MVNIETLLLRPDRVLASLKDAEDNPLYYFINIDDEVTVNQYAAKIGDVFTGAIVIRFQEEVIMSVRYWDYVDSIWWYLLDVVENTIHEGKGTMTFFNKSGGISLEMLPNQFVRFSLLDPYGDADITFDLPQKEFFFELVKSAEHFYHKMFHYGFTQFINEQANLEEKVNGLRAKLVAYFAE